ncbi:MAG TPA: MerR family transcriptional regulator [Nitrosomonas europaea]|uniref:MerR family transcriptional regulator n=1 Tax=Nitrosomonas sp. TaxID=42353 RepID=UPI0015672CC1|nr:MULTISPECIES: MerR family transcriptional regulator [Nitrosomonas]HNR11163.1 MerR family transcriptional regulator [Nitrosomonas europaea]
MVENQAQINVLPPIPVKRYFTIGEVSELCGVKPHVLRYWEQEFTQLRSIRRHGNRRYYQHQEVILIRRIRELLYDYGFTINGARNHLVLGLQNQVKNNVVGGQSCQSGSDFSLAGLKREIEQVISFLQVSE